MLLMPVILVLVFALPYAVEGGGERRPWGTIGLAAIFLGLYALMAAGASASEESLGRAVMNFYLYGVFPADFRWHMPLSSLFLHADIFHVLFNVFFLWLFGSCMERRTGTPLFLILFLLFGYVANLGYLYMNPGFLSHIPSIGSSASIAGAMGFVTMANPGAMVVFFSALPPHRFRLPAILLLIIWFIAQVVSGFEAYGRIDQEAIQVNYWAHIYGFIAGVLGGLGYRYFVLSKDKVKEIKGAQSLGRIIARYQAAGPVASGAELEAYIGGKPAPALHDRIERMRMFLRNGRKQEAGDAAFEFCSERLDARDHDNFLQAYCLLAGSNVPIPSDFHRAAGVALAESGNHPEALAVRLRMLDEAQDETTKERALYQIGDSMLQRFQQPELARRVFEYYLKRFPGGQFAKEVDFILTRGALKPSTRSS